MKNYRYWIPIALIALMALSWYQLITTTQEEQKQYDMLLEQARSYAEQGIITDAVTSYNTALAMKKSKELYQEISTFYHNSGSIDDRISWDTAFYKTYPKDLDAYVPLMQDYYEQQAYKSCFVLYDTIQARTNEQEEQKNEDIEAIMQDIEYQYEYKQNAFQDVSDFCAGYCAVMQDGQWGYIDMQGNIKIKPRYAFTAPFCGELAGVITEDGEAYFIDSNGNKKKLMPDGVTIKEIGGFFADRYALYNGSTYTYYNSEQEAVFGDLECAPLFTYDRALVKQGGNWTVVNTIGEQIVETAYREASVDGVGRSFQNERAFVGDTGKLVMIDIDGNPIGTQTYEDARLFAEEDGYAAVKKDGVWGYIDKNGNEVIAPAYDDARSFSNGYAAVCKNGKWGYIDMKNQLVIDMVFDDAREFNASKNVLVKEDGAWYMISLYKYNH